ncbi:MAG: hypothetical protein A3G34_10710 [Candidatus Lindowbacteria bacterium RIFCSPLOWO2_12_FULL_62_27]|nr:MAG: hypothetical protein A3G34_10710 [Candidatus Lindowbacteria bacterium RIFCSPLOWO2_12_FULL_62_27]
MTPELKTAAKVAAVSQIQNVRLTFVHSDLQPGFEKVLNGKSEIQIDHRMTEYIVREDELQLILEFKLKIVVESAEEKTAPQPGETSTPPLEIHAKFCVDYTVKDLKTFSEQDIQAFAKINAVFNSWPYWREIVQSTFWRMGLPPFVIPVFRMPLKSD